MPRIEVPFIVEKQRIKRAVDIDLVGGGQNYFYAIFDICDTWKKLSNIKAVFVRDDLQIIVDVNEVDGRWQCEIPWEVMCRAGVFQIGIFGGDRLPTHYTYVKVKKGCADEGDDPLEPTPDFFARIEKEIEEIREDMDELAEKEVDLSDYCKKEEMYGALMFKGEIEETSLPTEGNIKGDVYRIYEKDNIGTTEKYLLSGKYIYKAWTDDDETVISDGDGFDFDDSILSSDEDIHDFEYKNFPVNIYDTSFNKIGTCDLFYAPEIPLWVVKNSTVSLTLDEVYYVERTDGKIPTDSEPTTVEEFEKIIKGYAIFNGESFDKFYNDKTVDNKIAEVASTKADIPNPYEFIETITLTEDVTQVDLSTEPDGTPYSFDRFIVYITAPQATFTEVLRCIINRATSCGNINNAINSSYSSLSMLEVYCDKQLGKWFIGRGNFTNGWSNMAGMGYCYHRESKGEPITHVRLYVNKNAIPTGTTFEIWGVRNK